MARSVASSCTIGCVFGILFEERWLWRHDIALKRVALRHCARKFHGEETRLVPSALFPVRTTMTDKLDAYWMPFTANRQFKQSPRLFSRAEGMYYWTPEGRQVLDGIAGL